MSNWIHVNPRLLNTFTSRTTPFKGVEIIEGLSPDEIPERIRAARDQGECVIYFEYLSNFKEPRLIIHKIRPVTPVVGGRSGRLYQLRITDSDLKKLPTHVAEAISSLSKDDRFNKHQRHYEVAAEVVSGNAKALLPSI